MCLSLDATARGGGEIGIGATICCCGGTRAPDRMPFLFGSGGFLMGSTMRGAIDTGFFLADIGAGAASRFVFRAEEMRTNGATLAVFRSTFL